MGAPATTGVLRTSIVDMEIGDFIICEYSATSGSVGSFSNLGTSIAAEIPVTGEAAPSGSFYFVKCDTGLLISHAVLQHSLSWDNINQSKCIQGLPTTLGITQGMIRSLTGGVAYADANGNKSTSDTGNGAWPQNNEWDKYIVNFPQDKIQAGKTLDDVFHWNGIWTWTQDTQIAGVLHSDGTTTSNNSGSRVFRGKLSIDRFNYTPSSTAVTDIGFRPVFSYKE